ncbi:Uncharacterised protein [Paenibacillus macerans]|uniref:Uncharacterized protein n=1 Tax=Paenibacillus macerans TaxID=44252 RepID=A0A090ZJK8_PAEMA|nr:hypothetical protein DJ90_1096 [Paenibacillus macerans]GBK64494.1 hypothetical protein PbDSM24746_44980 [Paenibacillus macerans]GBK71059.1 hypothetical protein PbJCM17693_47670 [Paenibacillus macerans]GIP09899.1 hypothetical protein J1TS5_20690 [Paenibacillus macerans]SUD26513.1 Uncharacterised protein [Paenibacillus macerans]
MKSLWKFALQFLLAHIVSDLTYRQLAFFRHPLNNTSIPGFIFKTTLDMILFVIVAAVVFIGTEKIRQMIKCLN